LSPVPGHLPPESPNLISVALSVETALLREVLLEILASEPDVELIDYVMPVPATSPVPDEKQPDVVILSSRDPEGDPLPVRLLFASPHSRVLALTTDARRSFLYELRPHRIFLGELSRGSLLAALRGLDAEGGD
jgi:DNA-binding NarL/FixJ family response regulator